VRRGSKFQHCNSLFRRFLSQSLSIHSMGLRKQRVRYIVTTLKGRAKQVDKIPSPCSPWFSMVHCVANSLFPNRTNPFVQECSPWCYTPVINSQWSSSLVNTALLTYTTADPWLQFRSTALVAPWKKIGPKSPVSTHLSLSHKRYTLPV
jgi:hypothetical protein